MPEDTTIIDKATVDPIPDEPVVDAPAGDAPVSDPEAVSPEPDSQGEAGGDNHDAEVTAFSYDAWDAAESGSVFSTDEGTVKKVEGCDIPVPVIPAEDEMYQFLGAHGFDQNVINEEFWANGGELSEATLKGLVDVFGPGPVNSYMANVKAAHLGYLESIKGRDEASAREAEQAAAAQKARDDEQYGIVSSVFECAPEEAREKTSEFIKFVNENWPTDRRRDLKRILDSGSPYTVRSVLTAIKRDMAFASGEVHSLVDLGNTDTSATAAHEESPVEGVPNLVTADEYRKLLDDPRYRRNPQFANAVDAARIKARRLGK